MFCYYAIVKKSIFGHRLRCVLRRLFNIIFLFVGLQFAYAGAYSQSNTGTELQVNNNQEFIGIQEKLGDRIPLDLTLTDDQGRVINLKDLFGKPVIFSFVYYRCPGICSPLLAGLVRVVEAIDLVPGIDFNVVTLSIDPNEDFKLAADKKKNYFMDLKRNIDPDSWRWTVADQKTIDTLTEAFGWRYQITEDGHFTHSASIMAVSPTGKIARYLYGDKYLPFDLKMALAEATEERTGPTVAKLLKYCFSYDPEGRKYVFNILRVVGTLLLLWIVGIFFFVTRGKKANPLDRFPEEDEGRGSS